MDSIKIRIKNSVSHKVLDEKPIEEMMTPLNSMFNLSDRPWKPQADICETIEEIIIRVEIAGVLSENLEIEICENAITIIGKRLGLMPVKNGKYRLAEIQYGEFKRILPLPSTIDPSRVSTKNINGFLEINLTKNRLR